MVSGSLAIDVVTDIEAVSTPTLVGLHENRVGKNTLASTSITTSIEGRDRDDSVRHGES